MSTKGTFWGLWIQQTESLSGHSILDGCILQLSGRLFKGDLVTSIFWPILQRCALFGLVRVRTSSVILGCSCQLFFFFFCRLLRFLRAYLRFSGRPLLAQGPAGPGRNGRGSCLYRRRSRPSHPTRRGPGLDQQHCFSAVPWNMPSLTAPHLTYVLLTLVHSQTLQPRSPPDPVVRQHLPRLYLQHRLCLVH
jgi:hypothetical protein